MSLLFLLGAGKAGVWRGSAAAGGGGGGGVVFTDPKNQFPQKERYPNVSSTTFKSQTKLAFPRQNDEYPKLRNTSQKILKLSTQIYLTRPFAFPRNAPHLL